MNPYLPQSQRNPVYQNLQLGRCGGVTIGSAGCFITVAAMIDSHYRGTLIAPDVINRLALEQGLYVNGCLYPDDMLTRLIPGLLVGVYNFQSGPADLSKMLMSDEEEVLIVVDFDHNPNDGIQTHALRVFAWDGKTLIVDDPWYGSRENFSIHYGTNPAQTIQKIVKYRLPGFVPPWKLPITPPPAPPAPPVPPVGTAGVSQADFDKLAARVTAVEAAGTNNSEFLRGIRTAWDKLP